jgi:hypothetical protein
MIGVMFDDEIVWTKIYGCDLTRSYNLIDSGTTGSTK